MESFDEIYREKLKHCGDIWIAKDNAVNELETQRDELKEKYDELFNTVHDFMRNIDNYNVEFPVIMHDEWNEVNKLVGRVKI